MCIRDSFMGTQLWRTTVDMTDPMDRFTDLDPNGWAYPSIEYCVRHGLMSGMSDTIFSPKRLSKQDVEQLRYIPGTDDKAQYIMEAGIITTESKVVIPIVECRAPYKMFLDTVAYRQEIINLIDDEVNNFNRYPGVKFGSMEAGNNEAGNWE